MSKRKGKKIDNVLNNPSTPPSSEAINSSHEINISDNSSSDKGSSKRKNKKRKRNFNSSTQGRWTDEEHKKFVEEYVENNWKQLETYVPTRNSTQIRSHAQKVFIRIEKLHRTKDPLEYIRQRKSDTASNCSNSGISIQVPIQCECKVHSKKPEHFGTYLHPNYLSDGKESISPCDCACMKCLQFNRPNISKGKILKIRKRIIKTLNKINEKDHELYQINSIEDSQKTNNNEIELSACEGKLPSFTNLEGLKLIILSTNLLSQSKKKSN